MPRKVGFKTLAILLIFLASSQSHASSLEAVTITSDDKFPTPRWMYGEKKAARQDSTITALMEVKRAQLEENFDACLRNAAKVRDRAKSLHAWLAVIELDCASKSKPTLAISNQLAQTLSRVNTHPEWVLRGPQAQQLRAEMIDGYLTLIDQDLKVNRARAWRSIESVQDFLVHMDKQQKSRLWRMAGDLAFIEQKLDAAGDFMRRSLNEVDSSDLRQRLAAIDSGLGATRDATPTPPPGPVEPKPQEASADEMEIVERITNSLKTGEIVSAVDDAIKLIRNYPGSTRAKWATDRVTEAYAPLIDKTDSKYTLLRERILKLMEKADADRLAEWARWLFGRGQYADSFAAAKRALSDLGGTKRTGILDLAAKAALASDRFEDALDYSTELIEKHAGTRESREALFRAGLLNYRKEKYSEAAAFLEKVSVLPSVESLELSARYWLWRSYQKTKSERAVPAASELIRKFPFSYYGLRARFEAGAPNLEWKTPVKKIKSRIWLTSSERLGWERTQLLLKAGWLEEAQAELRLLPPPMQPDDKAVRALLWAAAGQYLTASKLASDAWDEKAELRGPPFMLAAYPNEFDTWITEQAKVRSVDSNLVRSLIKQESGFNTRALSASNALGLMQVITPTAKEIAVDLKSGTIEFPRDLFEPKRNIQFGTYYLSRLISKYQGNVPVALAAYNAGQGRIDRWLRARPSLKNIVATRSSAADNELWFDEIPYAETSFYVKAILRNLLIYRTLKTAPPESGSADESRVQSAPQLNDPLWVQ